jgi:type IV secretory pathway component VirB8
MWATGWRVIKRIAAAIKELWTPPTTSTHDKLEAYPTRLHVPVMPERRYLKTTRFLALASYTSICLSIALCLVVYITVPLQNASLTLYMYNDDMVRIQQMPFDEVRREAMTLYAESLVTGYVEQRNTFIVDSYERTRMAGDYDLLRALQNQTMQQAQADEMRNFGWQQAANPFNRRVVVDEVYRFSQVRWVVDFTTTDTFINGNFRPRVLKWRAYVTAGYNQIAQTLDNPLGFSIGAYAAQLRELP